MKIVLWMFTSDMLCKISLNFSEPHTPLLYHEIEITSYEELGTYDRVNLLCLFPCQ